MIISKTVKIEIIKRNIKFYEKLGYKLNINDILLLPIEQLTKGSHSKIIISCDICHKQYNIPYRDHISAHKIHDYDTCNKCKVQKSKLTNNIRYGCDRPLQNSKILDKYLKTNNERYGGNAPCCSDKVLDKQRKTRIKKGLESPFNELPDEFKKYRYRIDRLTKNLKKELFETWNGFDYYDGEYIKNNFDLKSNNRLYPSVDHKISVYYGFINNIDEKEIARFDNLAITKRCINSSKCNKNIDLFLESFNKII